MDANDTTDAGATPAIVPPPAPTRGELADPAAIAAFMLAGNATFTVVSEATGTRFTYKVSAKKGDEEGTGPLFVKVLRGADNEGDFEYLGTLWRDPAGAIYRHGRKSRYGAGTPCARGFAWLTRQVFGAAPGLSGARFYHEGRCCRCGRKLTVPESISTGWGPECARKA